MEPELLVVELALDVEEDHVVDALLLPERLDGVALALHGPQQEAADAVVRPPLVAAVVTTDVVEGAGQSIADLLTVVVGDLGVRRIRLEMLERALDRRLESEAVLVALALVARQARRPDDEGHRGALHHEQQHDDAEGHRDDQLPLREVAA